MEPTRTEVSGWRHTPSNQIWIRGKVVYFKDWTEIEVEGEVHTVCTVQINDPDTQEKQYSEVHPYAMHSVDDEPAGIFVEGVGVDDR